MTLTDDIFNLFNKELFCEKLKKDDFVKRTRPGKPEKYVFSCKHKRECYVDENVHPIWTPALGCDDSEVMVIGEAPSGAEEIGVHFGGLFSEWKNSKKSNVISLKKWVEKYYGKTPYFTDLVKCGAENQQDKQILKIRIPLCEYILIQEINYVRPKTIICLGNTAFYYVRKLKEDNKISAIEHIKKLTHYSGRAMLNISIKDKMNLIWEWQISSEYQKRKLAKEPLSKLSYFRKIKDD